MHETISNESLSSLVHMFEMHHDCSLASYVYWDWHLKLGRFKRRREQYLEHVVRQSETQFTGVSIIQLTL